MRGRSSELQFMAKRMLIDAAHPEETRVVVLNGNRLEEFDFESSNKKQIKGNIYLAKVTRVEPSLQAAFVEYGGNRHGFLAFNEIHPDYYRIPVADRQAALAAERDAEHAANAREDARERHDAHEPHDHDGEHEHEPAADSHDAEQPPYDSYADEPDDHEDEREEAGRMAHDAPADELLAPEPEPEVNGERNGWQPPEPHEPRDFTAADEADGTPESPRDEFALAPDAAMGEDHAHDHEMTDHPATEPAGEVNFAAAPASHGEHIETVGGDEIEDARPRGRPYRHYKIQEVIKRRQIMLVQVTKEERGNKGAALTTYLSLAGRYCVLMPNTPRGGGVSRKITNVGDRRRLKDLMSDLEVPDGMGVIVRTAGSERSKAEIKRDFEYLLRLWGEIRDLTLKSTAPALVYEEGNLIKRSIRDLYARDIEDVVVDGEEGYRTAKTFMQMLMPSHARRVKLYRDQSVPLFHRYQIEQQMDAIHSPTVQLRSGGYIVINQTEALVAIDVNSGRSTRERNIEETALRTNLEAAEEVARQLRLRDLAGLIVIDFIDMEEYRNRGAVERKLKEAMRYDRARIQLGRISPFGLLELSRQRLRSSLVEASTQPCPYCNGSGHIRSIESTALHVLRAIEEEGMRRRSAEISVAAPPKVALYILNQKRAALTQAEKRFGFSVAIGSDEELVPPAFRLERMRALTPAEIAALPSFVPTAPPEDEVDDIPLEDEEIEAAESHPAEDQPEPAHEHEHEHERESRPQSEHRGGGEDRGGRRHRRRRRGRNDEPRDTAPPQRQPREPMPFAAAAEHGNGAAADEDTAEAPQPQPHEHHSQQQGGPQSDGERRRRRRGRRGGRRRRHDEGGGPETGQPSAAQSFGEGAFGEEGVEIGAPEDAPETEAIELIPPSQQPNDPSLEIAEAFAATPAPSDPGPDPASVPVADGNDARLAEIEAVPAAPAEPPAPAGPPRRGWWRR
jgi:ribonuclease E